MKTFVWITTLLLLPGALATAAEPFSQYQWALRNDQRMQAVELDHMTLRWVPARPGEDLHAPATSSQPVKSGEKIIVAVLDTGLDKSHPDLQGRIVRKESECRALAKFEACLAESKPRTECEKIWFDPKNPEVDQDKNGYPLDCEGWSVLGGLNSAGILGRPDFGDEGGHGTHVAGTIAANSTNGIGIAGLDGCSENVSILPVQVLTVAPSEPLKPLSIDLNPSEIESKRKKPTNLAEFVARGLIYAIRNGAQVINFSMGWPAVDDSDLMRDLIREAQARGIVIVAAAGNDSTQTLIRPCGYPGVICVGAHGPDGAISHFSNYGTGVDLAAPGLNILSTWPMKKRPARFRSTQGYEYMHGTSQAAPYVSCMAAGLLARGYSAEETRARLIAGARPPQPPLEFIAGSPHELPDPATLVPQVRTKDLGKYVLSGNADFVGALTATPQPLILPVEKDPIEIRWDRRSPTLKLPFSLKNIWQGTGGAPVRVSAEIVRPTPNAVRPELVALSGDSATAWPSGETRTFEARLEIKDSADPALSRIPSELELRVRVQVGASAPREFIVRGEIVVPVSQNYDAPDALRIPLQGLPKSRYTTLLVDEVHDRDSRLLDYVLIEYGPKEWSLYRLAQDRTGGSGSATAPYRVSAPARIPAPEKPDDIREQIVARLDLDFDGRSEYVLGLMQDNTYVKEPTPSSIQFVILDSDFRLLRIEKYDSKLAQIPFQVTGMQVQWMKLGDRKVPAWIGMGKDPERKPSLRDLENNPSQYEKLELRFYYLDYSSGEAKLKAIQKHPVEGQEPFRIVDLLRPTQLQREQGIVPILLARDTGTETKPSYLLDFAVADVRDGKVENFRSINLFEHGLNYRNLLDTRVDSVVSLFPQGDQYAGTFWFGAGRKGTQRLSILNSDLSRFTDYTLEALRGESDAALALRAAFSGPGGDSAFVLTNSEIQFHDLALDKMVGSSLGRSTFFRDSLTNNLQFPLVVTDSGNANRKLPGLFTTENSRFSRGVKILVPNYQTGIARSELIELATPARLRFMAEQECWAMDASVWLGADQPYYLDYLCRDQILRLPLVF